MFRQANMRQTNEVPCTLQSQQQKSLKPEYANLLTHYQEANKKINQLKGYEFLNPKSKLRKHFNHKYNMGIQHKNREFEMQNQVKITMEGDLEHLSVGAMCEFVKQNLRKGADPYEPILGVQYQQQFIFARDEELFNKTANLLHTLNLSKLELKSQKEGSQPPNVTANNALDRIAEYRKEMTVREDGSMGAWGGKKYEGLGSQNQFTTFRREQSMSYYQNSHMQGGERKKN